MLISHQDIKNYLKDFEPQGFWGAFHLAKEKLERTQGHTLFSLSVIKRIMNQMEYTLAMRQHNPSATRPVSRKRSSLRFTHGIIRSARTPSSVEFSS